jgi:hypothetical protein
MSKYLIEVEHDEDTIACAHAVRLLITTGSHFLTNADWGCKDGVHKAWIIADLENKEEARSILPPEMRSDAKIVQLNKFTLEEIDTLLQYHANSS